MENSLLDLLVGLRASSVHSVVSEGGNNPFQEELYIETDLDEYLESNLKKTGEDRWDLIVLAGNAGDGKSALIRKVYSKLTDREIAQLNVNWDATHSNDPNATQLEILSNFFAPFLDQNRNRRPEKTHVIAMNTGMIISFFEQAMYLNSDAYKFSLLQNELYYYLDLTDQKESNGWKILLINLDHRNLLSFNQNDKPSIFRMMMEKLNVNNENSCIYEAFQEYKQKCHSLDPIYFNLMALSLPKVQAKIERAVYKTVIAHDLHFTPRTAWDLLYHLITADETENESLSKNNTKEIGERLFFNYMFTYEGDNEILKLMSSMDPCLLSTQALDAYVIQLSLQPQLDEMEGISFENEILSVIRDHVDAAGGFSKAEYAVFAKRRAYFFNENDDIENSFIQRENTYENYQKLIQGYITYCLHMQFGIELYKEEEVSQLEQLLENLRAAIITIFGERNQKDLFQIREVKNSGRFRVLTKLDFPDAMKPFMRFKNDDIEYYNAIHYFPREVTVIFKDKKEMTLGELSVNFGLFELLEYIRGGYNPSSIDLNRFYHFKFFCNQIFSRLAETSKLGSVIIHDRVKDDYINIKVEGLLAKKYGVEKV